MISKSLLLPKKLFIVVNVEWFFLSHRLPIALKAKQLGYEVTVFAMEEKGLGQKIRSFGLKFVKMPSSRSGTNIFQELKLLIFLFKKYKSLKPDIVHHVAVKPVTYGSIAAKLARVPKVVNALSGLGFLFINSDNNKIIFKLVKELFKFGFKNPNVRFILQNKDDIAVINDLEIIPTKHIFQIKGSGVNLNEFAYSEPIVKKPIVVLLPARMLWDKGVGEFVRAAEVLKQTYGTQIRMILAGDTDPSNKAHINTEQLLKWNDEKNIEWVGYQGDMVSILKQSDIVVLPSYREGLPKSLIEASAIGRPIVTTDVPGCREVVIDEVNGFLVPSKNYTELVDKISILIENEQLRLSMGLNARRKAEKEFSIDDVVNKTIKIYES